MQDFSFSVRDIDVPCPIIRLIYKFTVFKLVLEESLISRFCLFPDLCMSPGFLQDLPRSLLMRLMSRYISCVSTFVVQIRGARNVLLVIFLTNQDSLWPQSTIRLPDRRLNYTCRLTNVRNNAEVLERLHSNGKAIV